jgi:hypothetical protein
VLFRSIFFLTNNNEIVTESYAQFDNHKDAKEFAIEKIEEIKNKLKKEYGCRYKDIEKLFEYNFRIKEITDKKVINKIKNKNIKISKNVI